MPDLLKIYLAMTFITASEGGLNVIYPPFLEQNGYSLELVGGLVSLFAALQLVSRLPTGALYSRARARLIIGGAIWIVIAANVANILNLRAKSLGREAGPNDVEPLTLAAAEMARGMPTSEYARALLIMHGLGRQVATMFEKFDVLLSPVLNNPPLPLGRCSMQTPTVEEYARNSQPTCRSRRSTTSPAARRFPCPCI